MKNQAIEKEEDKANIAWFLASLAKAIQGVGWTEEAAATIDAAAVLSPDDEEIQIVNKEIYAQYTAFMELKKLQDDPAIDSSLAELIDP